MRIRLYNYMNSGWVAYDRVSLKEEGSSTNLAPDPGFEYGTGWNEVAKLAFPGTSFFRSGWGTAEPYAGDYAYAISNHVYGYLESDFVDVDGDTEYDLRAWVRGELDGDDSYKVWMMRARFYDSSKNYLDERVTVDSGGPGSLSTGWQQKGGSFTTPEGAEWLRIRLYNYMNSGWVAYDDVSLTNLGGGPDPVVTNPGFESGTAGWSEVALGSFPGTSFYHAGWGTAEPHDGDSAYAISNHPYGYLESEPVAVEGDTPYALNAWVRGELDADDSHKQWLIRARYYDAGGEYIGQEAAASGGPDSLTKAWQRKGDVLTTPADAATVRVRLYNYMNSGWVAFDDVVLAPVEVTKYYYLGARRVAMRQGDSVYYIVADHLGTTHLVLDAQGNKVAESRHLPYGEVRWSDGTLPTDYRFTGERHHSYIKLYRMGARFYDPYIARWLSADTIVPDPANPQSLNRYSWVLGNPLKYVDPTGYAEESEGGEAAPWVVALLEWYYEEWSELCTFSEFVAAYQAGLEAASGFHGVEYAQELALGMTAALVGEGGDVSLLYLAIFSRQNAELWAAAQAQDSEYYLTQPMAMVALAGAMPRAAPEVPGGEFKPFNFGKQAKIHWSGKTHGSRPHMNAILKRARQMARSGQYTDIYINKRISTATGGRAPSSKLPDITGAKTSGGYHLVEVVSPSQSRWELEVKCQNMAASFGGLAVTWEVIVP